MYIKGYKLNLFDWKNGHKINNISLNKFEETQYIDQLNIICDICKQNNKSISYKNMFYKCFTCNKNICPLCQINHDPNHQIINYDEKYYICDKHNEYYISYCEECNQNLCTSCDGHKNHKRIFFSDILPKKEDLIEMKDKLKTYIDLFNNDLNMIINLLNEVKNNMNIYYKINEDILNNYDSKKRNYEIIYNLNQLQSKNQNIILELDYLIKCDTITEKLNIMFNIYNKMNIDEINMIYKLEEKNCKLFGKEFVKRYKDICKVIIEGEKQELKDNYSFKSFNSTNNIFQIKLKGIKNVINMSHIFDGCLSLISLPDISNWNTSYINDMSCIFRGCESLYF